MTKAASELTLSWGVTPFVIEFDFIEPQNTIETGIETAYGWAGCSRATPS